MVDTKIQYHVNVFTDELEKNLDTTSKSQQFVLTFCFFVAINFIIGITFGVAIIKWLISTIILGLIAALVNFAGRDTGKLDLDLFSSYTKRIGNLRIIPYLSFFGFISSMIIEGIARDSSNNIFLDSYSMFVMSGGFLWGFLVFFFGLYIIMIFVNFDKSIKYLNYFMYLGLIFMLTFIGFTLPIIFYFSHSLVIIQTFAQFNSNDGITIGVLFLLLSIIIGIAIVSINNPKDVSYPNYAVNHVFYKNDYSQYFFGALGFIILFLAAYGCSLLGCLFEPIIGKNLGFFVGIIIPIIIFIKIRKRFIIRQTFYIGLILTMLGFVISMFALEAAFIDNLFTPGKSIYLADLDGSFDVITMFLTSANGFFNTFIVIVFVIFFIVYTVIIFFSSPEERTWIFMGSSVAFLLSFIIFSLITATTMNYVSPSDPVAMTIANKMVGIQNAFIGAYYIGIIVWIGGIIIGILGGAGLAGILLIFTRWFYLFLLFLMLILGGLSIFYPSIVDGIAYFGGYVVGYIFGMIGSIFSANPNDIVAALSIFLVGLYGSGLRLISGILTNGLITITELIISKIKKY